MSEKIFLLIICGTMCIQQILGAESLDHLGRRKRVINLESGGDVPLQNGDAPYVVNIRRASNNNNYNNVCVGAILSRHTVITVANCVITLEISSIKVHSGAVLNYRGAQHDVITKNIHPGNQQRRNGNGIALLTVVPAMIFVIRTNLIQLHQAPLLPGTLATIYGWGCNPTSPIGTNYRERLRAITVPIMNHRDCVNIYRGYFLISDNDVCTFDQHKRCGFTDLGAPLVVDNQLAGLHIWREQISGRISPDVFVVLQSLEYASWIRNNIINNVVHMGRSN